MHDDIADDSSIKDSEDLYRRIPPGPIFMVPDEALGGKRPSSAAFDNDRNGQPMSVNLASIMADHGRPASDTLEGHEGFGLASIAAGIAREYGQKVARDPLPDEPAHGLVAGKKNKKVKRLLAQSSRLIIAPSPGE